MVQTDENDPGLCIKLPGDTAGALREKFAAKKISTTTQSESLPVILVHLERLTGYKPEGEEHIQSLLDSIGQAVFDNDDDNSRLFDLLRTGCAFHSDTTAATTTNTSLYTLQYPDCIGEHSTRHMWRTLQQPSPIPVVERLWRHLRVCHQPLPWKYAIRREIVEIVDEMERRKEWMEWSNGRRRARLQQLYLVRETIHERYAVAQQEQKRLEEEREKLVQEELELSMGGGITAFFMGDDSDDDDDEYEPYTPSELPEIEETDEVASTGTTEPCSSTGEEPVAVMDAAEEKAQALRERCTTDELRKAMATTSALEQRVEQVDELLESLQDEEWAEEEEEEENGGGNDEPTHDEDASVLNSILAMILHALDVQPKDPRKHAEEITKEHLAILHEWKEYFGCLPPPLSTKESTLRDERKRLGIEDNDEDDWDA